MEDKGLQLKNQWTKPKLKKAELFKGIIKIVKSTVTSDLLSLPISILDTIESIKLDNSSGKIGWKLISRSFVDAILNLVTESKISFSKEDIFVEKLDYELDELLESNESFIAVDFFKNPEDLHFITLAQPLVRNFLSNLDFNEKEVENLLIRLRSYFVFSLVDEWRKNYKHYQILKDVLVTPFDEAAKRENEWYHYSRWLMRQIDAPVFSETFSLRQIYIPLRAYYKKKEKTTQNNLSLKDNLTISKKDKKIVVDLETELLSWVNKGDKSDNLRVLTGGPGYGKSSFLKMLAFKLIEESKRVLLIPLKDFEMKADLSEGVISFLNYDRFLTCNPFDSEYLIILFDGLDELSMSEALLIDTANKFIREIEKKLSNYNNRRNKIKIILSGRDVIVQQNEDELRNGEQILSILPYYLTVEEASEFIDDSKILEEDQRTLWWKKYGDVKRRKYNGLPSDLQNEDLDKITSQPLLNYLVALSFERGQIDFKTNPNLNEVYHDFLEAVYNRSYAGGEVLQAVKKLKLPDFIRMMEEIAVSTWHGNGTTTTVTDIEKHFDAGGIKRLFDQFVKDAEKGMISLLASFYFRQAGQTVNGTQTFEITHKSFGEYLTARRIANKISQINKNLNDNEENLFDSGWDIKRCLIEWVKLFGPKSINKDIIKYIQNEFKLVFKIKSSLIEEYRETVIKLINYILGKGLPIEELSPRPSYIKEYELAMNSEKALLIILGSLSGIIDSVSKIQWASDTSFGEWMGRLTGHRAVNDILYLNFLNHLNLTASVLPLKDFYRANLKKSILAKSDLTFANLLLANLQGIDLKEAKLGRANLQGADLRGADLYKADLREADLKEVDLRSANLEEANLREARLKNSDMRGSNLRSSDLRSTDLQLAKLQNADLRGADLKDADLRGANLKGALLTGASVEGAKIEGAYIDKLDENLFAGFNDVS